VPRWSASFAVAKLDFTYIIKPMYDLCVVVPTYNEQENVPVLFDELTAILKPAGVRFQLLLVDDSSRDRTSEIIRDLVDRNHNVRGLLLTRNFGNQAAVSIGLSHARGRAVAVMDADLQDQPEDLLRLYRRHLEGTDVVYAVRKSRPESFLKRSAYAVFYRILARMANISIPADSGEFCVMSQEFVTRLHQLPERLRYVRGLRSWLGGRQAPVAVEPDPRRTGKLGTMR